MIETSTSQEQTRIDERQALIAYFDRYSAQARKLIEPIDFSILRADQALSLRSIVEAHPILSKDWMWNITLQLNPIRNQVEVGIYSSSNYGKFLGCFYFDTQDIPLFVQDPLDPYNFSNNTETLRINRGGDIIYPVPSQVEERILAIRMLVGDKVARERLWLSNYGLIWIIVSRQYKKLNAFAKTFISPEELFQAGNVGLGIGLDRFDPWRGIKISTFVSYHIFQEAHNFWTLNIAPPFSLTRNDRTILAKAEKAKTRLENEGEDTSPQAIALTFYRPESLERLGDENADPAAQAALRANIIKRVIAVEVLLNLGKNLSLQEPKFPKEKYSSDGETYEDGLTSDTGPISPVEEDAFFKLSIQDAQAVFDRLAQREKKVLILSFGLEDGQSRSTRAVAKQLGISHTTVQKIQKEALQRLRESL